MLVNNEFIVVIFVIILKKKKVSDGSARWQTCRPEEDAQRVPVPRVVQTGLS